MDLNGLIDDLSIKYWLRLLTQMYLAHLLACILVRGGLIFSDPAILACGVGCCALRAVVVLVLAVVIVIVMVTVMLLVVVALVYFRNDFGSGRGNGSGGDGDGGVTGNHILGTKVRTTFGV